MFLTDQQFGEVEPVARAVLELFRGGTVRFVNNEGMLCALQATFERKRGRKVYTGYVAKVGASAAA